MGSAFSLLHTKMGGPCTSSSSRINIVQGVPYDMSQCLPGCIEKWFYESSFSNGKTKRVKGGGLSNFAKSSIVDKALLLLLSDSACIMNILPREVIFMVASLLMESLVDERIKESLTLPLPWNRSQCIKHTCYRMEFPGGWKNALLPHDWP